MNRDTGRVNNSRRAVLVAIGATLLAGGATAAFVWPRKDRPGPSVPEPEPQPAPPPAPERQALYQLKNGYKNAGVSFSAGDEYVASAGELDFDLNGRRHAGVVRLWSIKPGVTKDGPAGAAAPLPDVLLLDRAGDIARGFSVAFSSKGSLLVAGGDAGLHAWQTNDLRKEQARFFRTEPNQGWHRHGGLHVSIDPDGKTLALGRATGRIHLVDVESGKEAGELDPGRDDFVATGVSAFDPTGELIAAAGQKSVFVWNVHTRKVVATLPHQGVSSLAFSPRGGTLVTLNGTEAKFWDTNGWKENASRPAKGTDALSSGGRSQLAFDANGSRLALPGADGNIEILGDLESRETRYDMVVDRLPRGAGYIAFSRSGRMLATCQPDLIEVWKLRE